MTSILFSIEAVYSYIFLDAIISKIENIFLIFFYLFYI